MQGVDVGALSGALFNTVSQAAAEAVVLTMDYLDEDNPLNQLQKIQLVHEMTRSLANIEASFARELIDTLDRDGVQAWGLSSELERLLAKGGSNA
jgi:hypothetical protein